MDEATLIGEVISLYFNFFVQIFAAWTPYTQFRRQTLVKRSFFEIFNPSVVSLFILLLCII